MRGWIKLHRKVLDSLVFANEGLLKVWVYCLCRANHDVSYVPVTTGRGVTEVMVKPGEFIFGRKSAAKDLSMKPSTLYKRMQKLEKMGNINIQSNTHYSIVSICNWETYQDSEYKKEQAKEQAGNNQVASKEQAGNTDKNEKNVKNEKNLHPLLEGLDRVKKMEKPLSLVEGERLINEFGQQRVREILSSMQNYKKLLDNNVSTNLTARKWMKKDHNGQHSPDVIDGGTF